MGKISTAHLNQLVFQTVFESDRYGLQHNYKVAYILVFIRYLCMKKI